MMKYSIGGSGLRTCTHCYRLNDGPHDEWCPDCGKKDDRHAGGGGSGGGGGPGDPNIAPPVIDPGPGGDAIEAEFSEVPSRQDQIEHYRELNRLIFDPPSGVPVDTKLIAERDELQRKLYVETPKLTKPGSTA
jgi:hypothetical protein